jgi:Family of unknown function (DUF6496)
MAETKREKVKVKKVMREFKEHKLHSGSKKGPEVTNPKQAIAIALSEARKVGAKMPKKHEKEHHEKKEKHKREEKHERKEKKSEHRKEIKTHSKKEHKKK